MANKVKETNARQILVQRVTLDESGPLSADSVLARLATSRDAVMLQSNRFFIASIAFAILFAIKLLGLRLDLILFDYKVFQTPYGMAVFAFAANVSYSIAALRFLDGRTFDRMMRAICAKNWPSGSAFAYETYPQTYAWVSPTNSLVETLSKGGVKSHAASFSLFVTALTLLGLSFLPTACGIYFLLEFESLADHSGQSLQYWAVLCSVVGGVLCLLASMSLVQKDYD